MCTTHPASHLENSQPARLRQSYRGTSLIRQRPFLGSYGSPMLRALGWSKGGGRFLMSEVPLYSVQAREPAWTLENRRRGAEAHNLAGPRRKRSAGGAGGDSCAAQARDWLLFQTAPMIKAQGPSRTCNESKEEEEEAPMKAEVPGESGPPKRSTCMQLFTEWSLSGPRRESVLRRGCTGVPHS